MLLNKIQGKLQTIKGHLKEFWGRMVNNNETLCDGRRDQFFGRIREKYGITKEQAKERMRKFEEESFTASYHRL
jgi:uncharacterized protein YjbJ (UPF0337 family)